MSVRQIPATSEHLRAVVLLNGRAKGQVSIYRRDDLNNALHVDRRDLASARERDEFVSELPAEIQPEAHDLLVRLAELSRPQSKRKKSEDGADELPALSEDSLARAFTARYGGELRYTARWSRWNRWDGTRWKEDSTLHVYDLARAICREAAARCEDPKLAAVMSRANTIAAIERIARSDRAHAVEASIWDSNRWLLNTPEGTIDLHSGELREACADDHLTRSTAIAPSGDCPLWLAFLERVTRDPELVSFLQRMAGYCLTGDVTEHALFFLYGTGGNGKGTFLDTLHGILGDYASVSPIDTFTASSHDRHPTELAHLRGARLVSSQETEEGRRWAESRLKSLTGGDPITARFMRGDFFTFEPEFKLIIAGNHKPHLRTVDQAIRRRLHLIPFNQTIREEERDRELRDKLRREWPGILAWMIEGCQQWLESGLRPPASVIDTTEEYFELEDSFQTWLSECCEEKRGTWSRIGDLFESWRRWADGAGEYVGNTKRFSQNLQQRGFTPAKRNGVRGYANLLVRIGRAKDEAEL